MGYTRKLPRILPLPFRLAALARRRSGRGEGRGEGSLCVVHPTVLSVILVSMFPLSSSGREGWGEEAASCSQSGD